MARVPVSRVSPESFAWVINEFLASPKFLGYSASTQELWGAQLRFASHPDSLGLTPVKEMRPALVQAYLDCFADRPSKQATTYSALKQLEKWAIVRDKLPRLITTGCEIGKSDGGHIPWTDEQVAIGERDAPPALARAITLAANTGQRGSDLIKMRWTDIEPLDGHPGINVLQQKTGVPQWVPFVPEMIAAISRWERKPGFILERPTGGPWVSRDAITWAWWTERQKHPQLSELVLHGLRGTACVRLLRRGYNTRQISDVIGMSEKMVKRYTRFSEQKQNALAAVRNVEGNDVGTILQFPAPKSKA
jgi:integrase